MNVPPSGNYVVDIDDTAGIGRDQEQATLQGAGGIDVGDDDVARPQHGRGGVEIAGGVDGVGGIGGGVMPQREAVGIGQHAEVLGLIGHGSLPRVRGSAC